MRKKIRPQTAVRLKKHIRFDRDFSAMEVANSMYPDSVRIDTEGRYSNRAISTVRWMLGLARGVVELDSGYYHADYDVFELNMTKASNDNDSMDRTMNLFNEQKEISAEDLARRAGDGLREIVEKHKLTPVPCHKSEPSEQQENQAALEEAVKKAADIATGQANYDRDFERLTEDLEEMICELKRRRNALECGELARHASSAITQLELAHAMLKTMVETL